MKISEYVEDKRKHNVIEIVKIKRYYKISTSLTSNVRSLPASG